MTFDASELRSLSANLGNAGPEAQRRGQRALQKTLRDTENSAKNRVPVDTGNLKGSIGVTMTSALSGEVGPTANYGIFVELGTSRMAAQPFMGPAADIHFPLFEEAISQIGEGVLNG